MKLKLASLAFCACTIAILPAQTATQEKPAAEEAAAEIKAETPVEKQAFKIFDLVAGLPGIFGAIKDDASLAVAETKLDEMFKQLKVEETALLKLEVPDNEARKKLSAKMELKQKAMQQEMMAVMMGMQDIAPETAGKFGAMMGSFGERMEKFSGTMDKYFMTDEEKAAKEGK